VGAVDCDMLDLLLPALGGVLLVLLIAGVASVDLVRRDVTFRSGLSLLALGGLEALLPAGGFLYERSWDALRDMSLALGLALWSFELLCCAMLCALVLSRSLRPEGGWRWRKGRLLGGLLVVLALTPLGLRAEYPAFCLPLLWACSAALLGFARDGGPRLERGAATAISLLAVAWAALAGALGMMSLGRAFELWIEEETRVAALAGPSLLAVAATSAALWRPPAWPVLGLLLPGALAMAVLLPPYLLQDQPAVTMEPVPQLVDLSAAEVQAYLQGERTRPPSCVRRQSSDCAGQGAWLLSPALPLAETPDGPWVVHRPRRGLAWRLGYRTLFPADRTWNWVHHIQLEEVGGRARLVRGPSAGVPAEGFWAMRSAIPLEELPAELQRWERSPRGTVLVELPRSEVWTVQDAVSICASFTRASWWVQCRLSGP
jgi:hypothetical protein